MDFVYRIAVTRLSGDTTAWATDPTIAENLKGCDVGFLTLEAMWARMLAELKRTPAPSEIGRLAQLLKAAGLTAPTVVAPPSAPCRGQWPRRSTRLSRSTTTERTPQMPAQLERTSVPGVFKRGDAYVVVYRFDGRQHKRTCRSFANARSVKAQLKADIDRGEHQRGCGTFEDYARTWIDSYTGRTTRGFRESTRRGYRRAIEKRAIPYFSKRSKVMTDIGPPEIRGFIAWLFDDRAQGRVLSLGTVRADVAAVRALFATAVEDGVLRHNPALGVRISHPRPTVATDAREQRRALHQEDLARFLTACPEDWRLFFELLTHTGMRIGEAIELRWETLTWAANGSASASRSIAAV